MTRPPGHHAAGAAGFTLVETAVCVVLVGVMFVAALNTLGASKLGQRKLHDRQLGNLLADGLMAEALQYPYWDLAFKSGMGPAADEAATGDRSLYDDADDYAGWSASPPQHKDGTPIAGFDGWSRQADVAWVDPITLAPVGGESGVKRITVTVKHNGVTITTLVAYRSRIWDE